MEHSAFTAGVKPGGLTTDYEVKMLVCYILNNIGEPATFERLSFALQSENLVNYFELAAAVGSLEKDGNIIICPSGDEKHITLTKTGIKTAKSLKNALPLSVREQALRSYKENALRDRIAISNTAVYEKTKDGYEMTITIPDMGTDLLKMTFFVPTEERCKQIKRNFLQDPTVLYRAVISVLTGEEIMDGSIYDKL